MTAKNPGDGMVKPSTRVGIDVGHDIPSGILSMRPIAGKGEPTAARNVVVADRMPTPELRAALPKLGAEKAGRVRDVAINRKR